MMSASKVRRSGSPHLFFSGKRLEVPAWRRINSTYRDCAEVRFEWNEMKWNGFHRMEYELFTSVLNVFITYHFVCQIREALLNVSPV
jgi:hypothetical protein